MDKPNNHRKHHTKPIPLVGGIGISFGLGIGLLISSIPLTEYHVLAAGCMVSVLAGVLDDFHELSARSKLAFQALVAFLLVVIGNLLLHNLGFFPYIGRLSMNHILGIPLTILVILTLTNAVNMLDGLDGLMGSITLSQFICLGILAYQIGAYSDFYIILIIISSLIAFLSFNFPFLKHRASIFMGDAGTMLIGILLSWFIINLSQYRSPTGASFIILLWVVAFPLYDLASVVYRRIWLKQSPFRADRRHFHHIFQKTGLSTFKVVAALTFLSTILSSVGLLGYWMRLSDIVMTILFILGFFIYVSATYFLEYLLKKIK